jgi:hypothetical protein
MPRHRSGPAPPGPLSQYGRGIYRLSDPRQAVFDALQPLRCGECNRTIQPGESFSRISIRETACQGCRPFEILIESENEVRGEALHWASAAYQHVAVEIFQPASTDVESAAILLECIRRGREVLARLRAAERAARIPLGQGTPP